MSIGTNVTSDRWRLMPNRESVTLSRRRMPTTLVRHVVNFSQQQAGAGDPYAVATYERETVSDAWKRAVSVAEMAASQGVYLKLDKTWSMPKELLADSPSPGDVITPADGTNWTILDVAEAGALGVWVSTCRNLSLVWGLTDTIDIERPLITHDASGAAVREWSAVYSQLRARVQILTQSESEGRGIFGFESVFTVIVERQLLLTWEDRIKLSDGRYLDLKEYRNPERIEMLPEIGAVLRV